MTRTLVRPDHSEVYTGHPDVCLNVRTCHCLLARFLEHTKAGIAFDRAGLQKDAMRSFRAAVKYHPTGISYANLVSRASILLGLHDPRRLGRESCSL